MTERQRLREALERMQMHAISLNESMAELAAMLETREPGAGAGYFTALQGEGEDEVVAVECPHCGALSRHHAFGCPYELHVVSPG